MPDDDLIVISTLHNVYSSVVYKKIDQKAFYEPEMRLRLLPVVGFPLLLFKKTAVFRHYFNSNRKTVNNGDWKP